MALSDITQPKKKKQPVTGGGTSGLVGAGPDDPGAKAELETRRRERRRQGGGGSATTAPRRQKSTKPTSTEQANTVVPATGETFGRWLSRRYDLLSQRLPGFGFIPKDMLWLAAQPIDDWEVEQVMRVMTASQVEAGKVARERRARFEALNIPGGEEGLKFALATTRPAPGENQRIAVAEFEEAAKVTAELYKAGRLTEQEVAKQMRDLAVRKQKELLGGDEGLFDLSTLGRVAQGFETIYQHTVSRPLGFAAAMLGEGEDPGLAWRRAKELGPGRAWAVSQGITPGTAPFLLSSATIDFVARMGDPLAVAGRTGQALRLASRTPGFAAQARSPIQRAVSRFMNLTPDEVVTQNPSVVNRIFKRVRAGADKDRLLREFPEVGGYVDDIAAATSREEVADILKQGLQGTITGNTRKEYERRLARAQAERVARTEALDVPQERINALSRQIGDLERVLGSGAAPIAIRTLPTGSVWRNLKTSLARPDASTRIGRTVRFLTDDDWLRRHYPAWLWRSRVPARAPDLSDRLGVRDYFNDAGKLLGLGKDEVAGLANRAFDATSREEVFDVFGQMLKAGRRNLPTDEGIALTQWADDIGDVFYGLNPKGEKIPFLRVTTLDDGTEVTYRLPILETQLLDQLPMLDFREIIQSRSVMGRLARGARNLPANLEFIGTLAAPQRLAPAAGAAGRAVGQAGIAADRLIGGLQWINNGVTGFWKPAVLLRIGWPARVQFDEQARLLAAGIMPLEDPMTFLGKVAESVRHPVRAAKGEFLDLPEEAAANYGRLMEAQARRARRQIVHRNEKGYVAALHDELVFLRDSQIARYRAGHTKGQTASWLRTGEGAKHREEFEFLLPKVRTDGEPFDAWVQAVDDYVEGVVGRSDRLRRAVATGRLEVGEERFARRLQGLGPRSRRRWEQRVEATGTREVPLDSRTARQTLQDMLDSAESELPGAVAPSRTPFLRWGEGAARRGVAFAMDVLGSKPANFLSRNKAWNHFYRAEQKRLLALGVNEEAAQATARRYALEQVGELLYDASERTAFDVMVRNLIPFFPAWKEVLKRWSVTIPNQMGAGLGHAYIARKVQLLWDSWRDQGLIYRDENGEWRTKIPGFSAFWGQFIADAPGVRVDPLVRSTNMLGNWFGFGPLPSLGLTQVAEDSDTIRDVLDAVGGGGSLGPSALGTALRSAGIQPPWDIFPNNYTEFQHDAAAMDWLRIKGFKRLKALADRLDEPGLSRQEWETGFRDLLDDARAGGRSIMFKRAVMGFVSPFQGRLYWENRDEFNKIMAAMDKGLPGAKKMLDQFLVEFPEAGLLLAPKYENIHGEPAKIEGIKDFQRKVATGEVRTMPIEKALEIWQGEIAYQFTRTEKRQELAEIGTTWADWLTNADRYHEILDDQRLTLARAEALLPQWREWRDDKRRAAAKREGKPIPTLDEEIVLNGLAAMRVLEKEVNLVGGTDELSARDIRKVRAEIGKQFDLDRFYADPSEKPEGPERDIAFWFNNVYDPYLRALEKTYNKIDTATDAERGRLFLELRKYQDAVENPTISGVKGPRPEEYQFFHLSAEEQARVKARWALRRSSSSTLTKFQREQFGFKNDDTSLSYWYAVSDIRNQMREFFDAKGWTGSKKEKQLIEAAVEAWEQQTAVQLGLEGEYAFEKEAPFLRLDALNFTKDIPGWKRVREVALAAWGVSKQLSANKIEGRGAVKALMANELLRWVDAVRAGDPEIDGYLRGIKNASDTWARASRDDFYDYFFLGGDEPKARSVIPSSVEPGEKGIAWPAQGREITAEFGQQGPYWVNGHTGTDINGETGDPVYAALGGEVASAAWNGPFGNEVIVRDAKGREWQYAHLHGFAVREGDKVEAGAFLGEMGQTGNAKGSHLHLGLRIDGRWVDPLPLLRG